MFLNLLYIAIAAGLVYTGYTYYKKHKASTTTVTSETPPAPTPTPPAVIPPTTVPPTATLPSGISTPDPKTGFVMLTGVTNSWGKKLFSIMEVSNSLTGEAHASVVLNSGFLANGRYVEGGLIGVCEEIEAVADGTTGATTYRLKQPQVAIPGTLALPPSFTVASATAFYNNLKDPVVGTGTGFSTKSK